MHRPTMSPWRGSDRRHFQEAPAQAESSEGDSHQSDRGPTIRHTRPRAPVDGYMGDTSITLPEILHVELVQNIPVSRVGRVIIQIKVVQIEDILGRCLVAVFDQQIKRASRNGGLACDAGDF